MNPDERSTHFLGFAKLLWEDIITKLVSLDLCIDIQTPVWDRLEDHPSQLLRDGLDEIMQVLIAERAYDLFIHDRMHTATSDLQSAGSRLEAEMMIEGILDVTEWL